jgi:hypothetical protein
MNTDKRYEVHTAQGVLLAHVTKGQAREWMQAHMNTETLAVVECYCAIEAAKDWPNS